MQLGPMPSRAPDALKKDFGGAATSTAPKKPTSSAMSRLFKSAGAEDAEHTPAEETAYDTKTTITEEA